jgi:hypothetical protein
LGHPKPKKLQPKQEPKITKSLKIFPKRNPKIRIFGLNFLGIFWYFEFLGSFGQISEFLGQIWEKLSEFWNILVKVLVIFGLGLGL